MGYQPPLIGQPSSDEFGNVQVPQKRSNQSVAPENVKRQATLFSLERKNPTPPLQRAVEEIPENERMFEDMRDKVKKKRKHSKEQTPRTATSPPMVEEIKQEAPIKREVQLSNEDRAAAEYALLMGYDDAIDQFQLAADDKEGDDVYAFDDFDDLNEPQS